MPPGAPPGATLQCQAPDGRGSVAGTVAPRRWGTRWGRFTVPFWAVENRWRTVIDVIFDTGDRFLVTSLQNYGVHGAI